MYDDNDRFYDVYQGKPPAPRFGPSAMCSGCQYNKMPYCFAPNSNDRRIDALPLNFMCITKTVQKQEKETADTDIMSKMGKKLDLINLKLVRILKKMEKWD